MPLLRELLQLYLANKEAKQQTARGLLGQVNSDSPLANDPNKLAQLAQAAGLDSTTAQNYAQTTSSAPMSDLGRAQALERLQNNFNLNDIANASTKMPEMRAFNGMSQSQFSNTAVPQLVGALGPQTPQTKFSPNPIADASANVQNPAALMAASQQAPSKSGAPTNLLTPDQQDLLGFNRTRETNLTKRKGEADINLVTQEALSADANRQRTLASIPGIQAEGQQKQVQVASQKAADDAINMYFQSHPDARGRKLLDIFTDPTVDPDVHAALPMSSKYGDAFKAEFQQYAEKQREMLEIRGQNLTLQEREEWLPKLKQAHALEAYAQSGFQGPIKGYVDLFTGQQTPEAKTAADIMATGSPAQKVARVNAYNKMLSSIEAQANKGVPVENLQGQIAGLNAMVPGLQASGIPVQEIKYDYTPAERKSTMKNFAETFTSKEAQMKSLQTPEGQPIPVGYKVQYNPSQDPSQAKPANLSPDAQAQLLIEKGFDAAAVASDPGLSPEVKAAFMRKKATK